MGTPGDDENQQLRRRLLSYFQHGLSAVNGRQAAAGWLKAHPPTGNVYLIALGKAASAMAAGALEAAGKRVVAGFVVTRYGYLDEPLHHDPRLHCLEAGHPLPDVQSLAAGEALLSFLEQVPAAAHFLFLVSGGTSSLVEVPVPGVTLDVLRQLNRWLLGSGLSIADVNRVRASLSRIKGGRLANLLGGRPATVLLMSDVPGDRTEDIGSGLLLPAAPRELPVLPGNFASLPFQLEPVTADSKVEAHIVASNGQALRAAAVAARTQAQPVFRHETLPSGDARNCGAALGRMLLDAESGVHLWGGETTVQLPAVPGRGGRCQQLALAAAEVLAGRGDILLLAAGTDGSDGSSDDAGALVDGDTIQRGQDEGEDAVLCLNGADAGRFLEASGDLLHTGPTGSNVMDLIIGIKR